MRETHGVDDAIKVRNRDPGEVAVTVTDGDGVVELRIDNSYTVAGLSPEQARFIADKLVESADRLEDAMPAHETE